MSTTSLTAKYRPQTFADVAGQEAVKTILSRAAEQDRVAPAYLFSGTRGVGKTTVARIFAKALNCQTAPTAEPCNECIHCKQITAGAAVDVIEMDGASNRRIDDIRALKEDVGYAPIDARYKVFIIDEAHMLTKEAFNALLKTLEEPPPRATFIMATTEAHKFPATIISRCQHYTFKMLPQAELVAHLTNILTQENVSFEPGALEIIARRGAGSVRDSMSLLGQALALSADGLSETDVRNFLGLAGQDVFFRLMEAVHQRDLVALGTMLREVLDQGLDLGFFLRELVGCWRNMFLLRQSGKNALELLGLSGEEAETWLDWAGKFDPAHIHAAWQMTLDGQKKVMSSLEPALALELLLFNLASLPELVNLSQVGGPSGAAPRGPAPGRQGPPPGMNRPQGAQQARQAPQQRTAPPPQPQQQAPNMPPPPQPPGQQAPQQQNAPQNGNVQPGAVPPPPQPPQRMNAPAPQPSMPQPPQPPMPTPPQRPGRQQRDPAPGGQEDEPRGTSEILTPSPTVEPHQTPPPASIERTGDLPDPVGPRSWEGFVEYVANAEVEGKPTQIRQASGQLFGNTLVITCASKFLCKTLQETATLATLAGFAKRYFGEETDVRVEAEDRPERKSYKQLQSEAEANPAVRKVLDRFSAIIESVTPRSEQ